LGGSAISEQIQSVLIGTLGVDLALLIAAAFALRASRAALGFAPWLALAAQATHFFEEWRSGFHLRFPTLFGLAPWPEPFFLWFNAILLACVAAAALAGPRAYPARVALWFLAVAGMLNAIAHPAVALVVRGCFPGLFTSPLVGAAGLHLAMRLRRPVS
jgi:hypothetical protein